MQRLTIIFIDVTVYYTQLSSILVVVDVYLVVVVFIYISFSIFRQVMNVFISHLGLCVVRWRKTAPMGSEVKGLILVYP